MLRNAYLLCVFSKSPYAYFQKVWHVKWKILAVPKIPRFEKVAHFENDIAALK